MENDLLPINPNIFNGLVLNDKLIPEEMLIKILCRTDVTTLVQCQSTCRRWRNVIQNVVWRRMAEKNFKTNFAPDVCSPWPVYYIMSVMKLERNLLRNASGDYWIWLWHMTHLNLNVMDMETPINGDPDLPDDPLLEGNRYCYNFGDSRGCKSQLIHLPTLGFSSKFMDNAQPPIEVTVWCYSTKDAYYKLGVYLGNWDRSDICKFTYDSRVNINHFNDMWCKVSFVFTNYGPNITLIKFEDGGVRCKSAGACVRLLPPEQLPHNLNDIFT